MKTKLALAALSFVILTGFTACEERKDPPASVYTIPSTLLNECPPIPVYSEVKKDALMGSTLEYNTELMVQYNMCRTDKNSLNKAVKRLNKEGK